jgi:hypothetical protein
MHSRFIVRKSLGVLALSLIALPFSCATSIVVKLEKQQIFLAADTRQDRSQGTKALTQSFHDDGCKIIPLGRAAVAVGGFADYRRDAPSDSMSDWSALSDAAEAHVLYGHDLKAMAEEWAERGRFHFKQFYRLAPERVREMANTNSGGILAQAFIVGWSSENEPTLIWEKVFFDERSNSMIRSSSQVLTNQELPYTTHAVTQELFEKDSEQAKRVIKAWRSKSENVPVADRSWRWLEFVIQSTSTYDEAVGSRVNILRIPLGGRAEWLQNLTCP